MALEALSDLANLVAAEDGEGGGFASNLADALAGKKLDGVEDVELFELATAAALQADGGLEAW